MWPFTRNKTQKTTSLVIGLMGLLVVASTINTNPRPNILGIDNSLIGIVLFVLGLIYLISATSE